MKAAVFLDRDGTLNRCFPHPDGKTRPPSRLEDLTLLDGAAEACSRLKAAGYFLFVVTNQPDVRRGMQSRALVEEMNEQLLKLLDLDAVAACYHDDADHCPCRKPKPGMLVGLAEKHGIELAHSYMIGDRCTDVLAGRSAGCTTVLVTDSIGDCGQDHTAPTLLAAVDLILRSKLTLGSHHGN